jgi:flagellar motor switch protein FliN/FliY
MPAVENKEMDTDAASVAVEEKTAPEDTEQHRSEDQGLSSVADETAREVKKAEFQPITESGRKAKVASMDLLMDVTLAVSIELGRTTMSVKEILGICEGSVVEMDRAAGEPVDVMVGGRLLGKGEVVVLNDRFGVRITELVNPIEDVAKA